MFYLWNQRGIFLCLFLFLFVSVSVQVQFELQWKKKPNPKTWKTKFGRFSSFFFALMLHSRWSSTMANVYIQTVRINCALKSRALKPRKRLTQRPGDTAKGEKQKIVNKQTKLTKSCDHKDEFISFHLDHVNGAIAEQFGLRRDGRSLDVLLRIPKWMVQASQHQSRFKDSKRHAFFFKKKTKEMEA